MRGRSGLGRSLSLLGRREARESEPRTLRVAEKTTGGRRQGGFVKVD